MGSPGNSHDLRRWSLAAKLLVLAGATVIYFLVDTADLLAASLIYLGLILAYWFALCWSASRRQRQLRSPDHPGISA